MASESSCIYIPGNCQKISERYTTIKTDNGYLLLLLCLPWKAVT